MYPKWWEVLGWFLVGAWLGYITFQFWRLTGFLEQLFPAGREGNFKERLAQVLEEVKKLEEFKKQNLKNIQKVYLKRYNPYQDTGGDQSFSLSLLDGNGDGIVITSLHARSQTRLFTKPVRKGKEGGVKFSREEEEVVKKAYESTEYL